MMVCGLYALYALLDDVCVFLFVFELYVLYDATCDVRRCACMCCMPCLTMYVFDCVCTVCAV